MSSVARTLPIGGFFELAVEDIPPAAGSVWDAWARPFGAAATFGAGRAALAALIAATAPRRVWLPAYYCPQTWAAAAAAAATAGAELHAYNLTDRLEPDVAQLQGRLAAGDLAVAVDFFGWPPGEPFRDWARQRSDVVWVEDRAQTLWTTHPPWAPWCIFSPRKLMGVPDGGVLLGAAAPVCAASEGPPDLTIALPEMMRLEDRAGASNDRWYAAYRRREDGFSGAAGPMSRLTQALLHRIPIAPLVAARQANYAYLLGRLSALAAWPRPAPDVAPFGLVIAVRDAASLARRLAAERLFCARHWPAISADPARFPYEHGLCRQLLTLPCDHRYAPAQLERLADAVERLAPEPGSVSAGHP